MVTSTVGRHVEEYTKYILNINLPQTMRIYLEILIFISFLLKYNIMVLHIS